MVANSVAMGANVKTIGQRLNDNHIHCGYIGKWHLDGGDYFGLGTCPDGWDSEYWYDMRCYLEELTEEERTKSRKSETLNTCIFIVILKKSVPVINPAMYKIPRTLFPSIV